VNRCSANKPTPTHRRYPPERRLRKLLKRHLAYWTGLFVTRVLQELPLAVCSWVLSRIFLIWYVFFVKYRRRTRKHLRQVFGETRDNAWHKCVTRTMFMNLGRNLAEFLHIPRMPRYRITRLIDGTEFRKSVQASLSEGRGAICVTGHIGNWEYLAAYCARFFPTTVIAKRIYFDKFDREVVKRRRRLGIDVIYQDDGLRPIVAALRANRVVGILADQDIPDAAGVFVDFLGKEAYTPVAPSALALTARAPLFVVCMERLPAGHHRINISERVQRPTETSRDANRLEFTRRWSKLLADFIREHPDLWVWFHRRWRTKRLSTNQPG
jgi:KDO2-lipid IV(A) lauroyltransferase